MKNPLYTNPVRKYGLIIKVPKLKPWSIGAVLLALLAMFLLAWLTTAAI